MAGLFEGAFGDEDRAIPILEHDEKLFQVEAHKIPLTALIGQDSEIATNSLQDWEIEAEGVIPLAGVMDGEDVSTFNSQDLGALESYVAHLREPWKVTKVGGLVKSAAVKNQVAYQRKKALERLRKKIERVLGSGIEMARGNKTTPYMTRGAFTWMIPALQTLGAKAVPAQFQAPAAALHTTALDTFDAAKFESMLNAASEQKMDALNLVGQVGLTLKSLMSGWTQLSDFDPSTAQSLQNYTMPMADKELLKMVDTFRFDAGIVETMVNHNLCYNAAGAKTDFSSRSGIFMDLEVWKKRYMQHVKEFSLPDGGGGKRGYADAILMLKCGCPAGQLAVYTDSSTTA